MSEQPTHEKKVEPPFSGPLKSLEAWLYEMVYEKISIKLPTTVREWIVAYGPWVAVAGGVLVVLFVVPTFLLSLSITASTATYLAAYGATPAVAGPMYYLSLLVLAIQLVIMCMAIPMLLKRKRQGWLLMFYSSVVSLVYTVLNTFSYGYFGFGTLLGGLVGAAIGFYVLFQIRSYYKAS